MNKQEYEIVKNFSYEEYCDYLSKKYESADKTGLFKHHTFENVKANLSNPDVAKDATEEERNAITYCSFDEHLFLHILIGEQTDARKALGLGGAVTYIIPQLNKYFDCGEMVYSSIYYNNLDKDVFDILVERCDEAIAKTSIALDHNKSIYLQAEKYLEENGKALVVIGTGLGKTTTALEYLWEHKCRALVIGPNNIIKSGWEEYTDWCDTTTYQAFANNYFTIDYSQYGLVILDEAHHAGYDEDTGKGAAVWSKGIIYIIEKGVKVLGLTATPERSDKIDIGNTIFKGCVCEGFAVEDGIEKGIIHPFSYVTAYYDTNGIAEEYSDCENAELVGQLNLAINNTPTIKEIFNKHMPKNKRKGIIFIQEIADKPYVIDIFKDIYPDIEYRAIDSLMDPKVVSANRKWFEETDEGYLLAINMISEGAHYKGVNTLIMFRRTNSYLVYTQQLGRIITLAKDENPEAIVFDLVNNVDNVEYNDRKIEGNKRYSVSRVLDAIRRRAEKSEQIIVADETRDIVEAIRGIKDYITRRWLPEEEEILKNYYPSEGKNVYKRLKGRSKNQCGDHALIMGLKYINPYIWSPEEDATLYKYYPSEGLKVLDRLPQKTLTGVKNRVFKLGIKANLYYWDEKELNFLKYYYPLGGKYEVAKYLKSKTIDQIASKASQLHLKSPNHKKRVLCVETGVVYNSASEAVKLTKISSIDTCCRGKCKTAGGYHWEYVED